MNTMLIGILAIAALVWLFMPRHSKREKAARAKQRKDDKLSSRAARQDHPFQAVSLCSVGGGCPAVEAISENRYLTRQAPPLPLQECTVNHCKCKYVRHEDRRHLGQSRRELRASSVNDFYGARERRGIGARGRRKLDRTALAG